MNKDKYSLFLCIAIAAEIAATALLALSKGMSVWGFALSALTCYAFSYYFLTLSLKRIPIGLAYALWAGIGIVATSLVNRVLFDAFFSRGSVIGMMLIVAGVLVINLLAGKAKNSAAAGGH